MKPDAIWLTRLTEVTGQCDTVKHEIITQLYIKTNQLNPKPNPTVREGRKIWNKVYSCCIIT